MSADHLFRFAGMSDAQLTRLVECARALPRPTDKERVALDLARDMLATRKTYRPCANPYCPGQATHKVGSIRLCEEHAAPLLAETPQDVTEIKP